MSGFRGATSQRANALRDQKLLTKSAIARMYGVSRNTLTRLIDAGALTPVRIGSQDRIAEREWLAYLATSPSRPRRAAAAS